MARTILLGQGRTWEQSGEYSRAIDFYLQLTTQNCQDQDLLQDTWEKAVDLSLKFVPERSVDVVALVSDRLANMGRYVQAGELYLSCGDGEGGSGHVHGRGGMGEGQRHC